MGSNAMNARNFRSMIACGLLMIASDGRHATLTGAGTAPAANLPRNSGPDVDGAMRARVGEQYGKLPLAFEANKGQTDERVDFLARGRGYTLFLTRGGGATLDLMNSRRTDASSAMPDATPHAALQLTLVDSSRAGGGGEARERLAGKVNYLKGSKQSDWRSDVPTFSRVVYADVYRGIDIAYYGNQGQLEYDFIVHPGANPEQIRLRFDGADDVTIDPSGDLRIGIAGRSVVQRAPVIYQETAGGKTIVDGGYVVEDDGDVVFRVDDFDPRSALVIDPVLMYSTFLGGLLTGAADFGRSIAVDGSGIYVTGETHAIDFPTTPGAFKTTNTAGTELFVVKLDATGGALLYATYLGGCALSAGLAVDTAGNAYVTADSCSNSFPITPGAFDTTPNGNVDVIVAKLNATGSSLVYATYLGGASEDRASGIVVDGSGSAYITGYTSSANFPVTAGALNTAANANVVFGVYEVFVAKLNATGATLDYGTYLSGSNQDRGFGIAVDGAGSAYVTGSTCSTNFPTTAGAYDTTLNNCDAFVAKLDAAGSGLMYGTFLGGISTENGLAIGLDSSANAYVTGTTSSADFPTTPGAVDTTANGASDVFVAKLNATGNGLIYATYVGGSGSESGISIAVDGSGVAYVTGETTSTNFPTTAGAFDTTANGDQDAFVVKLNAAGGALDYGTYVGGSEGDVAREIALDSAGNAYVTGYTSSTEADFPTTAGAFDVTANGSFDAFVIALNTSGSQLEWSTFLGGNIADGSDQSLAIAVDAAGQAYVTGSTNAVDFPTTVGAYDATANGERDAFVVKLNAAGTGLDYATYVGGSSYDTGHGIAVDGAGSAYVAGSTQSTNFPVTAGAFDTTANGADEAFVLKLNPSGSALVFATYLGGASSDDAYAITLDAAGSAYVTGRTASTNFPTTGSAYDTTANGGTWDVFVAKLNAAGSALDYGTYLGGSGGDFGNAIALDAAGGAYVTGYTSSANFATPGAFDVTYGGSFDAFVAKLDASGAALNYATYLGGSGEEIAYGIAVDGSGNAYVTGYTASTNFPTTAGAFDTTPSPYDAFVSKLNPSGALVYGTFLGGSNTDSGAGIAVDSYGNAYVAGYTYSTNFPATTGSSAGANDVFVAKLNAAGNGVLYATYLGGSSFDYGTGIAMNAAGSVFVTGYTQSVNFPTTAAAFDTSNASMDGFLARLDIGDGDNDGVLDGLDNCRSDANANQLDTDHDGIGDVCDSTPTGQTAPTITFNTAPAPTYLGGNFTVSATTTNTDSTALTYSRVSGPCAVVNASGGSFSSTGAGACTVQADGAATTNFFAASAQQIVVIGKTTPTVSFGTAPSPTVLGANVTVSASTTNTDSSTLAYSVVSGPCALTSGATFTTSAVGTCVVRATGAETANFLGASNTQSIAIKYSLAACMGDVGHQILQPINVDGSSVFKAKATVPAKFRVCDTNGTSIGTPGVISSFVLASIDNTATSSVNEDVVSTNTDTAFRWDPTAMQWIFNINTKNLSANKKYTYLITLNDGSSIPFAFSLK
jgi:hypothetical protein